MITTKKYTAILMFVLFFFVGCIDTNINDESLLPNTFTATLPLPVTAIATKTLAPTLSLTAFPTIPTLPSEDAYALFLEMLNQNTRCELPCWLDITPGTSTHAQAYKKWASFLTPFPDTGNPRKFYYDFLYNQNDEDIFITTRYHLQPAKDTIDSMYVTTQTLRTLEDGSRSYVYDSAVLKKFIYNYLLSSVLTEYGRPDRILISMDIGIAEPTSPSTFNIWLFYGSRGAVINYEGEAIIKNNVISGCPSNTFVALWLAAPGSNNLHSEILDKEIWSPSSQYYKPTEDALGMTQEEFYNIFKEGSSDCFESPLGIWMQ